MNSWNFYICDKGYCFVDIIDNQHNEYELCVFYNTDNILPYRVQIVQRSDNDVVFEKDYKTQEDFNEELSKKYTIGRTHSCNCN